jgi:hypothetical protein
MGHPKARTGAVKTLNFFENQFSDKNSLYGMI